MSFEYSAYGSIELKNPSTLKDVEDFCREARRLGVGENARLQTCREGFAGPITAWHFAVPVMPCKEQ